MATWRRPNFPILPGCYLFSHDGSTWTRNVTQHTPKGWHYIGVWQWSLKVHVPSSVTQNHECDDWFTPTISSLALCTCDVYVNYWILLQLPSTDVKFQCFAKIHGSIWAEKCLNWNASCLVTRLLLLCSSLCVNKAWSRGADIQLCESESIYTKLIIRIHINNFRSMNRTRWCDWFPFILPSMRVYMCTLRT